MWKILTRRNLGKVVDRIFDFGEKYWELLILYLGNGLFGFEVLDIINVWEDFKLVDLIRIRLFIRELVWLLLLRVGFVGGNIEKYFEWLSEGFGGNFMTGRNVLFFELFFLIIWKK